VLELYTFHISIVSQ